MKITLLVLWIAACAPRVVKPAVIPEPPVMSEADQATARVSAESAFRTGMAAYNNQDFESAVTWFEEAFKWRPIPEIAWDIAKVRFYKLDQPFAARTWLVCFVHMMHFSFLRLPSEVQGLADDIVRKMNQELHLVYSDYYGTRPLKVVEK